MITEGRGSLIDADVEALVNTVNTVGVMGKGIALQFKRAFPDMFKDYEAAAKRDAVALGRMHVWHAGTLDGPQWIINFPTKGHWRASSSLRDIENGLDDLVRVIGEHAIRSIAVPPLGCGHGGLDWAEVEPLIRAKLAAVPDVDVRLFPPVGSPTAADMPSAGRPPAMTSMRAALIETVARYARFSVGGAGLIEVQKLMYFLQEAGEPLGLRFERHLYGPYADDVRHVLRDVEGHYLVGFGDGSSKVLAAEAITALPGAVEAAEAALADHPATAAHIDTVMELVEGYESAYSLELLASVHWVVAERPELADDPDAIAAQVHAWTERKQRLFTEAHVNAAWATLRSRGWLAHPALSS